VNAPENWGCDIFASRPQGVDLNGPIRAGGGTIFQDTIVPVGAIQLWNTPLAGRGF